MKSTTLCLAAFAAFGLASHSSASLPVSRTSAVVSVNMAAGVLNLVSLPYTAQPLHRSAVSSVSGSVVTLADAPPAITGAHVAQIVTGVHRGKFFSISSSSGATITLSAFTGVTLDSSDEIVIIPNWTLDALFPGGFGLAGGEEIAISDVVSFGGKEYYYNTDANEWRDADENPAGSAAVDFDGAIFIKPTSAKPVVISGIQRYGVQSVKPATGVLELISPPFVQATTLDSLTSKVAGGEEIAIADRVAFESGGFFTYYYYNTDASEWRDENDNTIPGSTSTPAGKGFIIISQSGNFISFP